MNVESTASEVADKTAITAYKFLRVCGLLWLIAWALVAIGLRDGWSLVAGFFVGLVIAGVLSVIPGLLALSALRNGTKHTTKAKWTAVIGLGLFSTVFILYAF